MGQKVRKGGEGGNEGVVEREVREEEVMGTFKERSSGRNELPGTLGFRTLDPCTSRKNCRRIITMKNAP